MTKNLVKKPQSPPDKLITQCVIDFLMTVIWQGGSVVDRQHQIYLDYELCHKSHQSEMKMWTFSFNGLVIP